MRNHEDHKSRKPKKIRKSVKMDLKNKRRAKESLYNNREWC